MNRNTIEPYSKEDFPSWELGPLYTRDPRDTKLPMYEYLRPADIFWAQFTRRLVELGWTKGEILALIQSKYPRHGMDSDWTDEIELAARKLAAATHETRDRCVRDGYYTTDAGITEATQEIADLPEHILGYG
jgi:hypothetical protein